MSWIRNTAFLPNPKILNPYSSTETGWNGTVSGRLCSPETVG
jgi:hypothetical protein